MTRRALAIAVPLALAALAGPMSLPARADDAGRGTAAQAQAMVADAIAYFDKVGAEAAFKTFNTDPKPRFYDRDLYIFVVAADGKVVAQAADPGRVGLDALKLKDAAGKPYGRWLVERATPQGAWVDYLRADPLTGKVRQKSSWVVRHAGYIFGCGIYKP